MKIGCHIAVSNNGGKTKGQQIANALLMLPEIGANAIQVFLSPRHGASSGRPINADDAEEVRALLKGSRTYLVVHGKYDLNFCDIGVKWYQDALIADLRQANQLGNTIGVVIHQGKNVTRLKLKREGYKLKVSDLLLCCSYPGVPNNDQYATKC